MTSPLATGAAGASSEAVRLLDALMGEMDWDHTTLANEYEAALLAYIAGVERERDANGEEADCNATNCLTYQAERDRLRAENARLREALTGAIEDVGFWGGYASEYFKDKHDLAGCLALHRAALAFTPQGDKNV